MPLFVMKCLIRLEALLSSFWIFGLNSRSMMSAWMTLWAIVVSGPL